jgi:hypothetical protein
MISRMPASNAARTGRLLLALALLCASAGPAGAAFSSKSAGTSGAAFLKIGAGARPTAMGEAFTAVADDVNTVQWNNAGLATLKKNEFVAMRAQLFQDLEYNFFAFAYPTKEKGTFAIAMNNLNIGNIEQRSADTDTPDGTFTSNDSVYTFAYARRLASPFSDDSESSGLHLGVSAKYIRESLAGVTASGFAADLGTLYRCEDRPLSLGFAVQNLGPEIKFRNEADPLPLTFKTGVSYRAGRDWAIGGARVENDDRRGLLLSIDGNFARDSDPSARLGAELVRNWSEDTRTAFRAGYRSDRTRQIDDKQAGLSAGFGLTYKFFSFDFSWVPFGNLGNNFRYSIKLRF